MVRGAREVEGDHREPVDERGDDRLRAVRVGEQPHQPTDRRDRGHLVKPTAKARPGKQGVRRVHTSMIAGPQAPSAVRPRADAAAPPCGWNDPIRRPERITWGERGGAVMAGSDLKSKLSGFRGEASRPGDAGYDEARAVFNGMIDRSAGADRAVHHRRRRRLGREPRAREAAAPLGVRRRPRRDRRGGVRRRRLRRPARHEGRRRRRGGEDGARRGRAHVGRARRRDAGARARRHRRARVRRPASPASRSGAAAGGSSASSASRATTCSRPRW